MAFPLVRALTAFRDAFTPLLVWALCPENSYLDPVTRTCVVGSCAPLGTPNARTYCAGGLSQPVALPGFQFYQPDAMAPLLALLCAFLYIRCKREKRGNVRMRAVLLEANAILVRADDMLKSVGEENARLRADLDMVRDVASELMAEREEMMKELARLGW